MDIIDLEPSRVSKKPNKTYTLLKSNFVESGFTILDIELRLYKERVDDKLGVYSLITSFVNTDKGSIEMIYDEGFRGDDILERTAKFIIHNLGLSSLILRSIISLESHLK